MRGSSAIGIADTTTNRVQFSSWSARSRARTARPWSAPASSEAIAASDGSPDSFTKRAASAVSTYGTAARTRELREESPALRERLRMRGDARDPLERGAGEREETVAHLEDLLADDLEVRVSQEVVRLVDRARGRVLDREERVARVAAFGLGERGRERRAAGEVRRGRAEVLARRDVAVRALGALERDAVRVSERALGGLAVEERLLLRLDGHRDDLAEDLRRAEGVEAELAGLGLDSREERGLAFGVTQERNALRLEAPDLADVLQPLGERLEQAPVRLVDPSSEVLERVHG